MWQINYIFKTNNENNTIGPSFPDLQTKKWDTTSIMFNYDSNLVLLCLHMLQFLTKFIILYCNNEIVNLGLYSEFKS
jgi:hypothetical protein